MQILPFYSSLDFQKDDFQKVINASDLTSLCKEIYSFEILDIINEDKIIEYLKSPEFINGSEFFKSDNFEKDLCNIIIQIHTKAIELGFPSNFKIKPSEIDFELTKTLYESLENSSFQINNFWINKSEIQTYMTLRIFTLICFWRWKKENKINPSRVLKSNRNYFFTLWITGYLFDKKSNCIEDRWELLKYLNSDIIVQIIERTTFGFSKFFAQAIIEELKSSGKLDQSTRLVRGLTKRAIFTLSTIIFIDEEKYSRRIVKYLLDWADSNYNQPTIS